MIKELDQDAAPVRIVPDSKYPDMYRLEWKDGSKSVSYIDPDLPPMKDKYPEHTYGLYNRTTANDILRNWSSYRDAYIRRGRLTLLKGST